MTLTRLRLIMAAVLLLAYSGPALAQGKLPAEKAGTIGKPTGKIAFVRDGNIWVMNPDGSEQMLVSEVTNADGRLSFAPDNRRILFVRSGMLDLKAPDMFGGKHKVYDLFIAYLDSAEAGKTLWWTRLTDDLGSRQGEWMPDGRILLAKDLNANFSNAVMPNYQVCLLDPETAEIEILRKDWQLAEQFCISPTINPKGDIAFTHFYNQQVQGLAIVNAANFTISMDSVAKMSSQNKMKVAPAWSPDGTWLAYVGSDLENSGIYLATPDLKEHYKVFEPPINAYPRTVAPGFSPDGKWLTFSTTDGSIWICDITGNQTRRLTPPGTDRDPAWSHPEK
jgi:Tol biopolymer transport system component